MKDLGEWPRQGNPIPPDAPVFGILSFTDLPLHAKLHCLIAKAMQLRGYQPLIFTYSGCRFGHAYFKLFGMTQLLHWDRYSPTDGEEAQRSRSEAEAMASGLFDIRDLVGLNFHDVQVGKHALSMTCRRRIEGNLDLREPATRALFLDQLASSIQAVLAAERLIKGTRITKLLVRDSGYVPNGAIFEAALRQGVDCVVYEQGIRRGTWIFKRYTPQSLGRCYFSISEETWKEVRAVPWTADHEEKLEREFTGRYLPDSTEDTRRLQSGKQIKTTDEVRSQLGLDPRKKTAVIFSHLAWDAAFFFGSCLFDDFEDWLYQTVKFVAAECPDMNWVVKLHPFNVFKLQREGKSEESEMRLLRPLMPLPDHVRLMRSDTDINTRSLFPLVDYALTVNGTVGMEFPCFGIPAVLGGTGRYEGFGFTMEPRSREEYFALLKRLHEVPRLEPATQELAKKHFLSLMTGLQYSLEDIAPMQLMRINEAQSDVHDNIQITARTLEQFRSAASLSGLADWLASSKLPDLIETLKVT